MGAESICLAKNQRNLEEEKIGDLSFQEGRGSIAEVSRVQANLLTVLEITRNSKINPELQTKTEINVRPFD